MANYRDDHEAALRRGQALERELGRVQDKLGETERALSAAQMRLATQEAEAEAEAASQADVMREAAEAKLARLRAKAEAAPASRPAPKPGGGRASPRLSALSETLRMARSMLWAGELLLSGFVVFLVIPITLLSFYLAIMLGLPLERRYVIPWLVGIPSALLVLPSCWALLDLWLASRWAASRGYRLEGYPELLRLPPPARDGGRLELRLRFIGAPPEGLDAILRGFEPLLEPAAPGSYVRPYPIRVQRSKHGHRLENADTNYPLHRWLRRLEREVLRPLHQLSPLESVELRR
ncbi:MAG: hypothetical protein OEY14_12045 [Myxococcales bacterium]|nr:hypothetical protein [Myxococcales bacterium]